MKNEPNCYRVYSRVMEGNHYSGGWRYYTDDVPTRQEAIETYGMIWIKPAFVELGDKISQEKIDPIMEDFAQKRRRKALEAKIKNTAKALSKLRDELGEENV